MNLLKINKKEKHECLVKMKKKIKKKEKKILGAKENYQVIP